MILFPTVGGHVDNYRECHPRSSFKREIIKDLIRYGTYETPAHRQCPNGGYQRSPYDSENNRLIADRLFQFPHPENILIEKLAFDSMRELHNCGQSG